MRGDPPVKLRYAETAENRSVATRREMAIKSLSRQEKMRLVGSGGCGGDGSQKSTGPIRGSAAAFFEDGEKHGGGGGVALPAEELATLDPFLRAGDKALGSDLGTAAAPESPVQRERKQQQQQQQDLHKCMFLKEVIEDK